VGCLGGVVIGSGRRHSPHHLDCRYRRRYGRRALGLAGRCTSVHHADGPGHLQYDQHHDDVNADADFDLDFDRADNDAGAADDDDDDDDECHFHDARADHHYFDDSRHHRDPQVQGDRGF
jgi:hypothetical protein